MLNYPDDFNTSAFPAGKFLAVSRFMSICLLSIFLLICATCVLLIWTSKSRSVHPFIISMNEITGKWQIEGHNHGENEIEYDQLVKESVISRFVNDWFSISKANYTNLERWEPECGPDRITQCGKRFEGALLNSSEELQEVNSLTKCAIYCSADDELYSYFLDYIVPNYQERMAVNETWTVVDYVAKPLDINNNTWRINATIESNINSVFKIIGYLKTARNLTLYPNNNGYYITDFTAYRVQNLDE